MDLEQTETAHLHVVFISSVADPDPELLPGFGIIVPDSAIQILYPIIDF